MIISVPLSANQERKLDALVREGVGLNKADVMRKALEKLSEDHAVEVVLRAEREPRLFGDLSALVERFSSVPARSSQISPSN